MLHDTYKAKPRATRMVCSCLTIGLAATGALANTIAHAQARAGTAATTSAAGPENAASSTNPNPSGTVATVVVTGTSIQSAAAAAYESAPVSVISGDAIQTSGAASLESYFQTQPDFVLSGQSGYSNTTGASGANGTTLGATTLNLRGIGPQYTLVLLNGRRFQAEDPANIDLIPVDAIERIEVLKSGASAIYGSDAVAGVVNIITKRSADGVSLGGYFGESGHSDNDSTRLRLITIF